MSTFDQDNRPLILEAGRADRQYWVDLWRYRELFLILAWRDVAVRYKQTVIGVIWAFVRPFMTMVVFTVVVNGFRSGKRRVTLSGRVFASRVTLYAPGPGTGITSFLAVILNMLRPGDFWRAYPMVAYIALYALLIFLMGALLARLPKVGRERLRAASWLLILVLGAVLSLLLPGATIFFLVAPAMALAGITLDQRSPRAGLLLAGAAAIVQFLMFAELLALIEMLLTDGPLWAVLPLAALAVLPVLVELDPARLRPALGIGALAALGMSAAALAIPRASAERPLGMSIDYYREANFGTAHWAIATKQAPLPPDFPGSWRKDTLPYNGRTRWVSRAPFIATPVATARLVASEPAGTGRRIRIALSPGGGDGIAIRFPESAKVIALGLSGEAVAVPADGQPKKAALRCTGRSCDGLVIEALLGNPRPITVELYSTRFALPRLAAPLVAARPRNAIPQYAPDSTITRSDAKL